MIFLSFAIWYGIENFLAITITIALETLDLYFGKHSKFKNKRTDFFFALSIIITFITVITWILSLLLLYLRLAKINSRSFMFTLVKDLRPSKGSLMIFYSCFFFVRILITILMFVSKQDDELLTVPFWGASFIICILLQLVDYKPWDSYLDNFTHIYSQALLIIVLMTGTIISAKKTFKPAFKDKEK